MADKEEMFVQEDADGTATVELNDPIDDTPVERQTQADSGDEDHPDDSEAVRAARRARRRSKKDLIRKTNDEKDVRLQMLQRQNEEYERRLGQLEQKTHNNDVNSIEKQVADQKVRLEYAKMQLANATASGDGNGAVQAQDELYEARRDLDTLESNRRQMSQQSRQTQVDPNIKRNASTWVDRNNWYDPNLRDEDSKIAKAIDETLTQSGWDPKTEEYWDELDNRLQKRLPHRYNSNNEGREQVRSPRNTVGSSGREASAAYGGTNKTFTLSAEMVRAMKDAGMWDNPDKRAKMIRRYATDAKTNSRN